MSASPFDEEKDRQGKKLQSDGESDYRRDRFAVKNAHEPTAGEPGDAEAGVE